MQEWEYLEVYIAGRKWADSTGAEGDLEEVHVGGHSHVNSNQLLDDLGEVGWELGAVVPGQTSGVYKMFFKRPFSGGEDDEAEDEV